jgi:hypothetical protein
MLHRNRISLWFLIFLTFSSHVIYVHIYLRVVRAFWGGGLYQYFTSGARVSLQHIQGTPPPLPNTDFCRYTLCHVSHKNEKASLPTYGSLILEFLPLGSDFLFFRCLKLCFDRSS